MRILRDTVEIWHNKKAWWIHQAFRNRKLIFITCHTSISVDDARNYSLLADVSRSHRITHINVCTKYIFAAWMHVQKKRGGGKIRSLEKFHTQYSLVTNKDIHRKIFKWNFILLIKFLLLSIFIKWKFACVLGKLNNFWHQQFLKSSSEITSCIAHLNERKPQMGGKIHLKIFDDKNKISHFPLNCGLKSINQEKHLRKLANSPEFYEFQ